MSTKNDPVSQKPGKVKPTSVEEGKQATQSNPKKRKITSRKAHHANLNILAFPVIGIGASAGGLEAVSDLLNFIPKEINATFVLIQHLALDQKSSLVQLLQRKTGLKVLEAEDGVRLESGHLYIIPSNSDLGIIGGALQCMPRPKARLHLPIDYFFNSLANDQGSNAVAIVMSGSGSDGASGIKSVRTEGGIVIAQSPETCRYDSMPNSAISSHCVDFVLGPEDMAQELVQIADHPGQLRFGRIAATEIPEADNSYLSKIFMLLRNRTGNDFSHYKHSTIRRRIARRLLVNKIEKLQDYVRFLNSNPAEITALFNDILINVTYFFRDKEEFEALKNIIFPEILKNRSNQEPIRIWVTACSTGEEAYSILICLMEFLQDSKQQIPVQVFASDIDGDAVDQARLGIYPPSISEHVSAQRLTRYFRKVTEGYQISKDVRNLCVFAIHNVAKDPPFSRMDMIACRNLLIYMNSLLQTNVLKILHYALNNDGFLLLGSSESIGASANLFYLADQAHKVYRKKDTPNRVPLEHGFLPRAIPVTDPVNAMYSSKNPVRGLVEDAENVILKHYGPPAVVVDRHLDIVQFLGQTGPFLDPEPGVASLKLLKLAPSGLATDLRVLMHKAIKNEKSCRKEGVCFQHDGKPKEINIQVLPFPQGSDRSSLFLIMFEEVAIKQLSSIRTTALEKNQSSSDAELVAQLRQQIEFGKTDLQTIIEQQEATNEELQSANEEILSANEELQSTNEEMETAKEELQSSNEELTTVNEELEKGNVSLATAVSDLRNIISSASLPIILLDEALHIRFFSPQATALLNLIPGDLGRPIGNIRTNINVGDLTAIAREVIETLQSSIKEVEDREGNTYSMLVRPYRTEDNRISGAVIVFVNLNEIRTRERSRRLETILDDSNDAILVLDFSGNIIAWNKQASMVYGYSTSEALDMSLSQLVPEADWQSTLEKIGQVRNGELVATYVSTRKNSEAELLKVSVTMSLLRDENQRPAAIGTTEHLIQ